MDSLRIAENVVRLRKQKGVTQEEMADFLGVTKASVSKWENKQSMPDIIMLPALASYFDVTVDELLGYEPQLSKEQIRKIYYELGKDFAEKPFEETYAKSEALVKKYYSCYPFLFQICVLWMNHFMLAQEAERQSAVLVRVQELCDHILENCKDTGINSDTIVMRATVDLQCGRAKEVIEGIGNLANPNRIVNQSEGMLIQAYLLSDDREKAEEFTQICMFLHLQMLVGDSIQLLGMHMQEKELCETTIVRTDKVIEAYRMGEVHRNITAAYQYQTAVFKSMHGEKEEALKRLRSFVEIVCIMMREESFLHGDSYFTKLYDWFENMDLGVQMVRSKKLVLEGVKENLKHPAFDSIRKEKEFAGLEKLLASQIPD